MNKMRLPFLLLLLFVAGCEKDFVIKEQASLKGLVINSLFNDINPVSVYVTDSYGSVGTNNVHNIADARLELYEDGTFKELLTYTPSDSLNNSGLYLSKLIPQHGKKYTIKAIHPVFGVATAEDAIPLPAQIVSQQLIQYPDTTNQNTDAVLKFMFTDDGAAENYYRINVWMTGIQSYVDTNGDTVSSNYGQGLKPALLSSVSDTVRDNGYFLLFSDKSFNGQQKEIQLKFQHPLAASNFTQLTIWVELHTVSKSHFEYFRTLDLYRHTNSANGEPVNVFSNVQNGYGIFVGEDYQAMPFIIK